VEKLVKKVLVDSNFLLLPFNCGIDIFREVEHVLASKVEFIVLTSVLEELKQIASKTKKLKLKRQVALAHELSEKCTKINIETHGRSVDDCLIEAAKELNGIVATGDMELKSRLRKAGIPVIYPRKGKYLVLEGYVN